MSNREETQERGLWQEAAFMWEQGNIIPLAEA